MKGRLKGLFSLLISIIGIFSFCSADRCDFELTYAGNSDGSNVVSGNCNPTFFQSNSSTPTLYQYVLDRKDCGSFTYQVVYRAGSYSRYLIYRFRDSGSFIFDNSSQSTNSTNVTISASLTPFTYNSVNYGYGSCSTGDIVKFHIITTPINSLLSDINTCQSSLSTCNNNLSSLSGQLNTCNSSLSTCQNDLITCQGNSCPEYTYYTPNGTGIINGDFMVRNLDSNYITTELNELGNDIGLDLYFKSSSIDHNYCESNNLCSIYTGDSGNCSTGDISWSSVYINDIQHIGGPSINIDIPEEISWDYNYSNLNDMYINVEGYNVDYDKISGIVDIQNYKPSSEDFNKLVSEVLPLLIPGLVIILFLYFIFRFIKKIF